MLPHGMDEDVAQDVQICECTLFATIPHTSDLSVLAFTVLQL